MLAASVLLYLLWPIASAVAISTTVLVIFPALLWQQEFHADDFAADNEGGAIAVVAMLRSYPRRSGTFSHTHPSRSMRVRRQERRHGRPPNAVAFEAAIEEIAAPRDTRTWFERWARRAVGTVRGWCKTPFARRKRRTTAGMVFAAAIFVGAIVLAFTMTARPLLIFAAVLIVGTAVASRGWVVASGDAVSASLRVRGNRGLPGVYEIVDFVRSPFGDTRGEAAEVAAMVLDLADNHSITMVCAAATDGLDERYRTQYGFESADQTLGKQLGTSKRRPLLVRAPRSNPEIHSAATDVSTAAAP
ncbi:hypothetical protein [Prescottella agglutinans]|uniref:hypothetical protein n=1 Tax=Prescottella agglutinans TaxID=1644129 RepID=UPI002476D8AA|nr:hypothetical protein [Prescottella agglutinans]